MFYWDSVLDLGYAQFRVVSTLNVFPSSKNKIISSENLITGPRREYVLLDFPFFFLYLNVWIFLFSISEFRFFVSFLLYDFFCQMTFYPLPTVLCSLGLTIFRKSFRSDIRRFFWAWKFWFHRPFPYSFSEHTQWNEVEAIHIGSLLGWTIGRTVMRQRARQKSNRFKFKAKEQLCTCITLFWTWIRP